MVIIVWRNAIIDADAFYLRSGKCSVSLAYNTCNLYAEMLLYMDAIMLQLIQLQSRVRHSKVEQGNMIELNFKPITGELNIDRLPLKIDTEEGFLSVIYTTNQ